MDAVTKALVKARSLIESKSTWTTGVMARNALGESVPFRHPCAIRFCSWGAMHRAAPQVPVQTGACIHDQAMARLERAAERMLEGALTSLEIRNEPPILTVNDRLGHAAALTMFDHAISETH